MFSYLSHLLVAKGPDRVHSPFVFDLYFHTLRSKYKHYSFKKLDKRYSSEAHKSKPIIAESIFKIVNKLKPQNILCISDCSTKTSDYVSNARKSSHVTVVLVNEKIDLSQIPKKQNVSIKPITPSLLNKKYDLVIIDVIDNKFDLDLEKISQSPIIINTNIKTIPSSKKLWKEQQTLQDHNIQLDFFFFGISLIRKEQKKEYFRLRL